MRSLLLLLFVNIFVSYSQNASEISTKLKSISNQLQVKVVYLGGGNSGTSINPQKINTPLSQSSIRGFDTETKSEITIIDNSPGVVRPLICYSGERVIYTKYTTNEASVYVVNWNGTGNRKIVNGIAGCLWFDSLNKKEYVIYGKTSSMLSKCKIFKMNIDNPVEEEMILDLTSATNDFSSALMSISKDGILISICNSSSNVPNEVYSLRDARNLFGSSIGDLWGTLPYFSPVAPDTVYRMFSISNSHADLNIYTSSNFTSSVKVDFTDEFSGEVYFHAGQGKFASYDKNYYIAISGDEDYKTNLPGIITLYHFNDGYTAIDNTTIAAPSKGAMPDLWVYKTGGPEPKVDTLISLTDPNGGNVFNTLSNMQIQWVSSGPVDSVKIELLAKDKWKVISERYPNEGNFLYAIPDDSALVSERCRIKVSSIKYQHISDSSENFFKIKKAITDSIKLISPKGSEICTLSSTIKIGWKSTGNIDSVKIELIANSKKIVIKEKVHNNGEFAYQIPDDTNIVSSTCRIKISSTKDSTVVDSNTAYFSIIKKIINSIDVTSPAGGENFMLGSQIPVKWTSTGNIDSVKIELISNSKNIVITEKVYNNGEFAYQIPDDTNLVSSTCRIKVRSIKDSTIIDSNITYFSIAKKIINSIDVTSPAGGENFMLGSQIPVKWTSTGNVDSVKIVLLVNDSNNIIIEKAPNTGSFNYSIAENQNYVSTKCRIKVSHVNDSSVFDTSSHFSISKTESKSINLQPLQFQKLSLKQTGRINWASIGNIEKVKITLESKTYKKSLANELLNNDEFTFTVPDNDSLIADSCRIIISEITTGSQTICSDTSTYFNITKGRSVEIKSPSAGDTVKMGNSLLVKWVTTGEVDSVYIYILYNGNKLMFLSKIKNIVDTITFKIPNASLTTTECRVLMKGSGAPAVSDTSEVFHIVKGPIADIGGIPIFRIKADPIDIKIFSLSGALIEKMKIYNVNKIGKEYLRKKFPLGTYIVEIKEKNIKNIKRIAVY